MGCPQKIHDASSGIETSEGVGGVVRNRGPGRRLGGSEQWATTVYAGYDRLVGDAGDSPITRRLGSQDQFTVGARLSYSFAITPFWR